MGSPIPGMDPYIEELGLWEDFHHDLISEIKSSLANRLPERYVIRAGERSYVALAVDDSDEQLSFLPDVAVTTRGGAGRPTRKPKTSASAAAVPSESGPLMMRALVKAEYREAFLEIRQADSEHKLITGIEVLSPSNKRPDTKGWRLYNRKRLTFLSGYANLVEIDLLRRGRRMPMASAWPNSPYYLLVCRKKQALRCSVWPAYFTAPLPPITIPLARPDVDISLDIQPFVAAIYARSRYERDIDYRRPISPPLTTAEAAWLQERLRELPRPK
jgi:hypothetical protein